MPYRSHWLEIWSW